MPTRHIQPKLSHITFIRAQSSSHVNHEEEIAA